MPAREHARGRFLGARHLDVADDNSGELARRKPFGMEADDLVAREPFDAGDRPFDAPPVRMAVRVEPRHHAFARLHSGIVLVLTNGRDDLALARLDLVVGKRWRHQHLAEQREHRLEILREARARQRSHVPRDVDGERDAAPVEVLGDVRRGSRGRSAIDDARQQPHGAWRISGIADGPCSNREVDGNRGRGARLLGDEHDTVVQDDSFGL